MIKLNLQQFGGRGSGSGGDLLGKSGDPGKVSNIRDMISMRGQQQQETDDVLSVARRMTSLFGQDQAINQFQVANMTGSAMAYYDSDGNIAMNQKYMNTEGMNAAYDAAVKSGFHPGRGNKSGTEAVASHEYGHALADKCGQKLGQRDIEAASRTIVERARKKTGQRTNMAFAQKISGYAQYNFAECVAEAVSDWHCNGSKAKKESRAIVAVMNSILKH